MKCLCRLAKMRSAGVGNFKAFQKGGAGGRKRLKVSGTRYNVYNTKQLVVNVGSYYAELCRKNPLKL